MAQENAHFSISKDVGLHNTNVLEGALHSLPGVESVSINKAQSSVSVHFDSASVSQTEIEQKIEILGYPIERP